MTPDIARYGHRLGGAIVLFLYLISTPYQTDALLCVADCNRSGDVSVDEAVMATRIALGSADIDVCEGADANHDGLIDVHELVSAVLSIVEGCYSEPQECMPAAGLAVARAVANVHNLQRAVVAAFAGGGGSGPCDFGGGVDATCEDPGTGIVRVETEAQSCRIGSLEGRVGYDGTTVLVGPGICMEDGNILLPANLSFEFDVTGVYEFPDGSPSLELGWLGSLLAEGVRTAAGERCQIRGIDSVLEGDVSFRSPDGAEVSIGADETTVVSEFADFIEEGPGFRCEPQTVIETLDGPARIDAAFGEDVQVADVTFRGLTTTFHRDARLAEIEGEVRGACFGGAARFATPEPLHLPLGSTCFNAGVLQIGLPTGTAELRAGPGGAVEVDANGDGTPEEIIATCFVPECGNGIIEAREQCDAENADFCPTGVCDPDCTCATCLPRDPTFGGDGIVVTDAGGIEDFPGGLVIQPDGKIVVAGAGTTDPRRFTLIRYSPDGSLDESFDGDGIRSDDFEPGFNNEAFELLLQPDGKLVAVGRSALQEVIVARYLSDGSLDDSFGAGAGFVEFTVGDGGSAHAGALYDDGGTLKIVVAGQESFVNQFVVRLDPDGSFDSDEFGSSGVVITDIEGTDNETNAVAVQPDGKIVTAGFAGDEAVVVRYDADGELDETFGTDGIGYTKVNLGAPSDLRDLVIQPDGRIVAVGATGAADRDFLLVRFDTSGQSELVVTTDISDSGSTDEATTIALQPDGKLVVGGLSGDSIAVVRYNPDGSLFCSSPSTTTTVPGNTFAGTDVAIQPDGNIVVAGTLNPGRSDYVVVRYLGSACEDGTIGCENDGGP